MSKPFTLSDRAVFFPQACIHCGSIDGPFLDGGRDLPVAGRDYVCQGCGKEIARGFGFAEGERMDELADAATLHARSQRELEKITAERDALVQDVTEREQRIETLEADNQTQADQIEHLKSSLKTEAAALAAVAGD